MGWRTEDNHHHHHHNIYSPHFYIYINTASKIEYYSSSSRRWFSYTPVPVGGGGGLHFGFRNLFIDKCNMKKTKKGT